MSLAIQINSRNHRLAINAFYFIAGLTSATWASRIPDIKSALNLSEAGLGLVMLAAPVGEFISMPLSGWLITRFGSRWLMIAAALFYPFSLLFLGVASSGFELVAVLACYGMAANTINIAMNTQAVGVEKIYGRSIMASFHGLWSLAGFTGALTGALMVNLGLSPVQHFMIIFLITLALLIASFKHTWRDGQPAKSSGPIFVKPGKHLMMLGLIAFCCLMCEGAIGGWPGVYFQKIVKAPVEYTTLGFVAFMGTMATGRLLGDRFITNLGPVKVLRMSGILMSSGLLLTVMFPSLVTATLGFLLVGFGVSCVVPLVYALAGRSKKMSAGMALTSVSTIGFLGFLAGPPLIGFIAELTSLRISFLLVAIIGFGTTLLASQLREAE
jgi:MFS family permease